MPKYRSKLFKAERCDFLLACSKSNWKDLPDWVEDFYNKRELYFGDDHISIHTNNGIVDVGKDDMIIFDINGRLYKHDIERFNKFYEITED